MTPIIRRGLPRDDEAIAALHVQVWRETYRDMAPADAYRLLDVARRLPYWQDVLGSTEPARGALIAEHAGAPVGVISFAPARPPFRPGASEIKHLYVQSTARGLGLGRSLMLSAFDALRLAGQTCVQLAVVQENTAARAFYARTGGQECGTFVDPGPLWRSSNVIVEWNLSERR